MRGIPRTWASVVLGLVVAVAPATGGLAAPPAHAARHTSAGAGLPGLLSPQVPGVAAAGGRLYLNSRPHFFTGVNAYSATTDWSVNRGCGAMIPDLNVLFDALPAGSLIRTWAFQALAFNEVTHKIDFAAIDRAVAAATSHHDYLILDLSDQAGTCDDGHFHSAAWYGGGYRQTYDDNGRGSATTMSYLHWVRTVVGRYKASRTVAIYEPVNEPEASICNAGLRGSACFGHTTCPADATSLLRNFFDRIGRVIKGIDPRVLVSSGVIGGTQCGLAGRGFRTVSASTDVDIATFHDYTAAATAMPGVLLGRIRQAAALTKPFLVDEAGINAAATGVGCRTPAQRASAFAGKLRAAREAGVDGYLPWNFDPTPSSSCSYAIAPGAPRCAP